MGRSDPGGSLAGVAMEGLEERRKEKEGIILDHHEFHYFRYMYSSLTEPRPNAYVIFLVVDVFASVR